MESVKNTDSYNELQADIKMLRDIHEHWEKDEKDLWALKKFKRLHENIDPKSIGLIPFKRFEAGGLDLNEVQGLILKLEDELGFSDTKSYKDFDQFGHKKIN